LGEIDDGKSGFEAGEMLKLKVFQSEPFEFVGLDRRRIAGFSLENVERKICPVIKKRGGKSATRNHIAS